MIFAVTRRPGGLCRVALACALAACGRLGYDATPSGDELADDTADAPLLDDSGAPDPIDAARFESTDAGAPSACDESCSGECSASGRCQIACTEGGDCGDTVVCPDGQACDVACSGLAACAA